MVSFTGILILALWNGVFSMDTGIIFMLCAAVLLAAYNLLKENM